MIGWLFEVFFFVAVCDFSALLLSSCRIGEFTLRVADPQLFSQPEKVQVQAVSMQVMLNK